MNRKVIFVPDDYWTHPPKENPMTNYADTPNAADARRAAALTIHHRQSSGPGVLAIVEETSAAGRTAELLLAVMDLHSTALSQLRSDTGIHLMANHVQELANHPADPNDPHAADIRRAARLLDAHGRQNTTAFNTVTREAADLNRGTQLTTCLLDLYEHLVPELSSEAGTDWLQHCIAAFATEEVEGQQ